jgi:general stress protein YciG/DNA-binding transcriptional regulator YiaG
MPAATRKIVASAGGRAAHQHGRAHEFSSQEAATAGRKGGHSVSMDRAHMSKIGKLGGQRRWLLSKLSLSAKAVLLAVGAGEIFVKKQDGTTLHGPCCVATRPDSWGQLPLHELQQLYDFGLICDGGCSHSWIPQDFQVVALTKKGQRICARRASLVADKSATDLAALVFSARTSAGLSRRQLAAECGLSEATVRAIESGRSASDETRRCLRKCLLLAGLPLLLSTCTSASHSRPLNKGTAE